MKTVVAVVAHDRVDNVRKWVHAWKRSDTENAELRIIHNLSNDARVCAEIKAEAKGVTYIPRSNVGMDIGALQDVCRNRLRGWVDDFDYVIWCTDDTLPIRPSFIREYEAHRRSGTDLVCYEVSDEVKRHARTTGLGIPRQLLRRIQFDADPVRTKDDCYKFEHRSARSLYNQFRALGLSIAQPYPVSSAPLWDSGGGGRGWVDRQNEWERVWKWNWPSGKVIVIAPAFVRYPVIVPSMLEQTYPNWELHLVHDGPAPTGYKFCDDERIIFTETPSRRKEYGHPIRIEWLHKIRSGKISGDYVVITNEDNYHVPVYLDKLVAPLAADPSIAGTYCSMMVHNYKGEDGTIPKNGDHFTDGYGVIDTSPRLGYMDCAAALIRAEIAGRAGWPSTRHSSDWDYLNRIAQNVGGWHKFKKVFGALLVHN